MRHYVVNNAYEFVRWLYELRFPNVFNARFYRYNAFCVLVYKKILLEKEPEEVNPIIKMLLLKYS